MLYAAEHSFSDLSICSYISLQVFEGDGLPNMICRACKFQLEKSYTFKKRCENSDLKLRRHLKLIQERIIKTDAAEACNRKQDGATEFLEFMSTDEPNATTEAEETPSNEQDIVGARVAYLQPDDNVDENYPSAITLPVETEDVTKEACTLNNDSLKKEVIEEETAQDDQEEEEDGPNIIFIQNEAHHAEPYQDEEDDSIIDENNYTAIAEAVKQTLANQPGLNLNGELQIKLDSRPGHPTQVHVTTEDGSVVLMELLTEEDQPEPPSPPSRYIEQGDDGELKVFLCPDCPKSFSRRIQLRRHASVHVQQRGYSCGICEKWFPTRSALIRHERIHTGERPFKCNVCQKSFAQKEILFRHLMTHTGEKPYNCPHCPKGFTQKEALRTHMRTHTSINPEDIQLHRCTLCPKVFCHASGLSRHLVTHAGRTYQCGHCDKTFTDKSSLRRHHKLISRQY